MAQITLYVPDEVASAVKRSARRARKSVSAYVVDLLPENKKPRRRKKQVTMGDLLKGVAGSWKGDFPEFPDSPPRRVKW